ncbi:DUF5324 family protein [Streptomyces sp. NBC_01477]|uniref:DUF5324 family protein n=1 Tax=Streptomyces sp. NBC_01477 TaxID=2976015 RepID=UPI002E3659FF|nr:DUF5324 family protein [Streptomyces sp. NBC_01477]
MTRIDSVRNAADITKDSVRHAAEAAAPYASTAKDEAARYAQQAGTYAQHAGALAKQTYDAKLAAQVRQARGQAWAAVPPKAAEAVETAARRTRDTARTAADFTAPKVGSAVAATRAVAVPVTNEAVLRGAAALHALRGQVTAADIDRLVRRRVRRQRTGRVFRGVVVAGLVGGAAFAAWRWWSKQANPDWLVEPTEPTDADEAVERISGTSTLTVVDPLDGTPASVNGNGAHIDHVDGSPGSDPEVEATRYEEDNPRRDDN